MSVFAVFPHLISVAWMKTALVVIGCLVWCCCHVTESVCSHLWWWRAEERRWSLCSGSRARPRRSTASLALALLWSLWTGKNTVSQTKWVESPERLINLLQHHPNPQPHQSGRVIYPRFHCNIFMGKNKLPVSELHSKIKTKKRWNMEGEQCKAFSL